MHRCNASAADLLLDTWHWRFDDLAEAVTIHRKLAGYRGAQWPAWKATLRRLHELQHWCAELPQGQRAGEPETPAPRQRPLFPLRPPRRGQEEVAAPAAALSFSM